MSTLEMSPIELILDNRRSINEYNIWYYANKIPQRVKKLEQQGKKLARRAGKAQSLARESRLYLKAEKCFMAASDLKSSDFI